MGRPECIDLFRKAGKKSSTVPPSPSRKRAPSSVPREDEDALRKRSKGKEPAVGSPVTDAVPITTVAPRVSPARQESAQAPAFVEHIAVSELPEGILWSQGLSQEIAELVRPPPSFYDAAGLSDAQKRRLNQLELDAFRAVSLIRPYVMLKVKYNLANGLITRLKGELRLLKQSSGVDKLLEDRNRLRAELQALTTSHQQLREAFEGLESGSKQQQEELQSLRAQDEKMRADLDAAREALAQAEGKVAQAELDAKRLEDVSSSSQATLARACAEAEKFKAEAERLGAESEHLRAETERLKTLAETQQAESEADLSRFADAAMQSFNNAVAQIRALNPDVNFNTSGMSHTSYVGDNGELVPLEADEDEEGGNDEEQAPPPPCS